MRVGLMYMVTPSNDKGVKSAPNGVAYLASYLEKYNGIEDCYIEIYYDKLMEKKPDIVGISSVSEMFPQSVRLARRIKEWNPKTIVIIGGPHITARPQDLDYSMDAGVISEGEQQFSEVVSLIQKNDFNPENLSKIKGIVYRDEDNNVVNTGKREWLKELDLIPPPARHLVKNISMKVNDYPYQHILMTERGCPFKCEYCSATAFWDKMRSHSIERVMTEIEDIIRNYPEQRTISISDDLFGLNKKRLRTLVDLIRAEGYHKKVGFVCQTRASCFNEDVAEMFAQMNMRAACFGFESANDRVLKFLKGAGKTADNQRAIDLCAKYGIEIVGNFIIGSPTETEEEMADTYWFTRKNDQKLLRMNACTATPFPGTKWWDYALKNNLVDESFKSWEVLDLGFEKDKTVFMNDQMSQDKYLDILNTFRRISIIKNNYAQLDADYNYMYDQYYKKQYEYIAKLVDRPNVNLLEISNMHYRLKDYTNQVNIDRIDINNNTLSLDLKENYYDFILLPYTLEAMREPEKLLENIKTAMKDNSKLLIISHNIANIEVFYNLLSNKWKNLSVGVFRKPHISFFSVRTIYATLTKLGFKNLSFESVPQPKNSYQKDYQTFLSTMPQHTQAMKTHMSERDVLVFFTVCSISKPNSVHREEKLTALI